MYSNIHIIVLKIIKENILKIKCIVEKQQRYLVGVYYVIITKTFSHIIIHSFNK